MAYYLDGNYVWTTAWPYWSIASHSRELTPNNSVAYAGQEEQLVQAQDADFEPLLSNAELAEVDRHFEQSSAALEDKLAVVLTEAPPHDVASSYYVYYEPIVRLVIALNPIENKTVQFGDSGFWDALGSKPRRLLEKTEQMLREGRVRDALLLTIDEACAWLRTRGERATQETLAAAHAELEARSDERAAAPLTGNRTLAELLAEVHAAPDDDAPRLVYADALLQHGDPRGELIALQIARSRGTITDEGRAREAELLRDRARLAAWARPLSAYGECTFERGFPATIELDRLPESLADPAWAIITGVRGLSEAPPATAARLGELPSLRAIEGVSVTLLEDLCRTPRPWTRIRVLGPRAPSPGAIAALPALRELSMQITEPCEALDLPPGLVRLDVEGPGAPPRMDLARLVRLEELRLVYNNPGEPLVLPPSLQALELHGFWALPDIVLAGRASPRRVNLRVGSLEAHSLRGLTGLEALQLWGLQYIPEGALDGLVQLRELALFRCRSNPLPPRLLAGLPKLEELTLRGNTIDPELDGLPLRCLHWNRPLDRWPPGLPLERATARLPEDLDQLERFLARYPALAHLALDIDHLLTGNQASVRRAALWRRTADLLERSRVQRCTLGSLGDEIALERDDDGLLSRLQVRRGDNAIAELLAGGLTRITSIESTTTKLSARLARLVR